jgi:hypothetical protein
MESLFNLADLNAAAFNKFINQPVNQNLIRFVAEAAFGVITCDADLMPAPATLDNTALTTPRAQRVLVNDGGLPTLEQFITQLVRSSNVQVPTLISTLVYLSRLRSSLQAKAWGLHCTPHRIFLTTLILTAKYLNDSSPKNKHWASYSHINTDTYSFGFDGIEINLMENQLLFLLNWNLRIREWEIYREIDPLLAPIRDEIELAWYGAHSCLGN